MSDEKPTEHNDSVSKKIDAVANLAKAVPVYDDALKPIAIETGKALSTVGRAVNVALSPIRGLVWGAEAIEEWVFERVSKKLEEVEPEKISTPDVSIAGPTFEALRFSGHKAELSELFAGLLASAMDQDTSKRAHPVFVDFIKSMTPTEARILAALSPDGSYPFLDIEKQQKGSMGTKLIVGYFCPKLIDDSEVAKPADPYQVQSSIENLSRMGLINATTMAWLVSREAEIEYDNMKTHDFVRAIEEKLKVSEYKLDFSKGYINLTQLGKNFCSTTLR